MSQNPHSVKLDGKANEFRLLTTPWAGGLIQVATDCPPHVETETVLLLDISAQLENEEYKSEKLVLPHRQDWLE